MIDLFRPFVAPGAREALAGVLTPDPTTGRLYIGQGKVVDNFERALQTFLVSEREVLTTNSCTSALDLAFHLCDLVPSSDDYDPAAGGVVSTPMTCVSYLTPVLLADGTTMPIGQIVHQRLTPDVLSYDTHTGRFVSRKVTGWTKLKVRADQWRRLTHEAARGSRGYGGRRGIWITGDHRLWTERGFVAVDDLGVSDCIATNERAAYGTLNGVIDGMLLGDGFMRRGERGRARLLFAHAAKQGAWVDLKRAVLGAFEPTTQYKAAYKQSGMALTIAVPAGTFWDEQYDRWYPRGRKIIPRDVEISPALLATWYLDDGCRERNRAVFCTEGFDDDSVLFVAERLREFGIFPTLVRHRGGGLRLYVGNGGYGQEEHYSAERFFTYIGPYVPAAMRYKVPDWAPSYDGSRWFEDGGVTNLYARPIVEACEPPVSEKPGSAYCIEVDETHTFVAGGMVLSNCSASNSPIVTRGGRIYWADVDPLTGLIDPKDVGELVRSADRAVRAVVAVDWGGHLVDYQQLRQEMGDEAVPIVQDAAHSFGATAGGVPFLATPQHGDFVAFSFQAIKHLTTGDGGALVCPDQKQTDRARLLRWYGLDRRSSQSYRCEQNISEAGYKYHMNDIAASIGLVNLPYVEHHIDQHRANANYYGAALHGLRGVILHPSLKDGDAISLDSTWWLFTILVSDRDSFQVFMAERGVETSQVHARNDHHTAFEEAEAYRPRHLPGLEFFAAHQVSIPVGWWLLPDELDYIMSCVQEWSRRYGRDLEPPERR